MMINPLLIISLSLINGIHSIQNGIPALPGHFSSVVSIWQITPRTNNYRCSGTIISKNHILTAAHCLYDVMNFEISIIAGSVHPSDGNQQILIVENIYIHSNFQRAFNPAAPDTDNWLNDIALLKIKYDLIWSPTIIPVELDRRAAYSITCDECFIAGWNPVTMNMVTSLFLQWIPAMVIPHGSVGQSDFFLLQNEMTAVSLELSAAVNEMDSGTPLICGATQVGIVIGGRRQPNNAVTWLTIAPYMDFIDYILNDGRTKIYMSEAQNIASIYHFGNYLCGGIIVHDYHIVTAAHCVNNVKRIDLRVVSGRIEIIDADKTIEWLLVESIEIHPYYEVVPNNVGSQYIKNDIAILKLPSKLPWVSSMELDKLPDPRAIPIDKSCEVLRIVQSSIVDETLSEFMKSSAIILDHEQCENAGVHLQDEQFCAASLYSLPLATHGDIGNPMVCMRKIIGMVVDIGSTVRDTPTPTTFLQIFSYREFINDAIDRSLPPEDLNDANL